jgi:hypothetical protein
MLNVKQDGVTAGTERIGRLNKGRQKQNTSGRNGIFLDVSKGVLRSVE